MSDDIREGQDVSDIDDSSPDKGAETRANLSRRKFTKASLIAPPVLMTLVSKPALGAYQCSVSGAISGNQSNVVNGASCGSKSAGWYKTQNQGWTGYSRTDRFDSSFSPRFGVNGSSTLEQVLGKRPGANRGTNNVGKHAVGALLNAAYFGSDFGFTQFQIIYAWNNYSGDAFSLAHDFEILNHRWDPDSPPNDNVAPGGYGIENLILDWTGIPTS